MVKRIGGNRRKTRNKFQKSPSEKGKINIRRFMQTFDEGNKVALVADTAVAGGLYHRRFHGKTGSVVGKRGWCYLVAITDGGKSKTLIVHPAHLKAL